MLIEIRKAGFINKGAELMLLSVLKEIRHRMPNAKYVMTPNSKTAPYDKRAALGLYQKAELWRMGIQIGQLAGLIPKKLRDMYGVILDKELDAVIDISGFSYSDQCGLSSSHILAKSCKQWKKSGTKVILLSQAFGPFNQQKNRESIKIAVDNIDLIFAREISSYNYLTGIVGLRDNIKIAPDFTNLISGILPEYFKAEPSHYCLVPNYRMIDRTSKEESEAYLPFMAKCARYLVERNTKPFILVHEGADDFTLAKNIVDLCGYHLPIINETNPLYIKGIISTCAGIIGSRYHSLISALSQGVPALATGWSHKYKLLFDEYGLRKNVLNVTSPDHVIYENLELLVNETSRLETKKLIERKAESLIEKSNNMWSEVFTILRKT